MRYLNRLDTVTILLIVANILFFVYEVLMLGTSLITTRPMGNLNFASVGGLNANTPMYTYITSMFLHGSITHILMNMLALGSIGLMIKQGYGSIYYILGYFISGLGANVLSVMLMPETTTVGASGAIFGLFGMYVVYSLFEGGFEQFTAAAVSVGLSLASGLVMPQVNIWAHLGGLIIGLVLGFIFMLLIKLGHGLQRLPQKERRNKKQQDDEPRMYY